ncbi:MerR family transcriptional regulator [Peptoniphilus sp. oral taxon 386]|uniref:MerR family transcriptional regulator n=1 Tax=Peptoniphilus sp. oral taxon 386 TaxID=652713 RepID=UPI0001DA9CC1|nr:MerR family transcriptional regulator [Peptoniphilus sp. oral taxon 386]EFI42660.1 transcriptional regulator, MerR family [Peptoniphilus sp. oral taxon 386 str. F0131]
MKIQEVKNMTGLTRKAIEYYIEKNLLEVKLDENGYRNYSYENIKLLNKIKILRKFNLSISQIKEVLENPKKFEMISNNHLRNMERNQRRMELFKQYLEKNDDAKILQALEQIENERMLEEKFLEAFPGVYGQLIFMSYLPFLKINIESEEQQQIYNELIDVVDELPKFELPKELEEEFENEFSDYELFQEVNESKIAAVSNFDRFLNENKDIISEYIKFKNTDEYKDISSVKIGNLLKEYMKNCNYYEKVIPLMRKLSPDYNLYYENLEKANKKFLEKYPDCEFER